MLLGSHSNRQYEQNYNHQEAQYGAARPAQGPHHEEPQDGYASQCTAASTRQTHLTQTPNYGSTYNAYSQSYSGEGYNQADPHPTTTYVTSVAGPSTAQATDSIQRMNNESRLERRLAALPPEHQQGAQYTHRSSEYYQSGTALHGAHTVRREPGPISYDHERSFDEDTYPYRERGGRQGNLTERLMDRAGGSGGMRRSSGDN